MAASLSSVAASCAALSALAPHCALPWTPHDVLQLEAVQFRLYGLIELVPLNQTCTAARGAVKQCLRPCSLQVNDSLIDMLLRITMTSHKAHVAHALFVNLRNGLLRAPLWNHVNVCLPVMGTATYDDYEVTFLGRIKLGCQANGCKRKSKLLGEVPVRCSFPAGAMKPMFRIGDRSSGIGDTDQVAEVCSNCLYALCVEASSGRSQSWGPTEDGRNTTVWQKD